VTPQSRIRSRCNVCGPTLWLLFKDSLNDDATILVEFQFYEVLGTFGIVACDMCVTPGKTMT
jgi:hypothetical protein